MDCIQGAKHRAGAMSEFIYLPEVPDSVMSISFRPMVAVVCAWHGKDAGDEWAALHGLTVSHGICKACAPKLAGGIEDEEIAGLRRLSAKVEEVAQETASSVEALQKARAAVYGISVEEMLRRDEAVALKAVAQVTQEVEA